MKTRNPRSSKYEVLGIFEFHVFHAVFMVRSVFFMVFSRIFTAPHFRVFVASPFFVFFVAVSESFREAVNFHDFHDFR